MKRNLVSANEKEMSDKDDTKRAKYIDNSFQSKEQLIEEVFSFIQSKKHIVALVGAGISVDSGIPDFRSKNGFFHIIKDSIPKQYSVEDVFDATVFREDPSLFYSSIQHIYSKHPSPSIVHRWLQTLHLNHLFTQNIDGLESSISCPTTYLHGCLLTGTCTKCNQPMKEYTLSSHYSNGTVAYCACGGVVKPDIVFYGDKLRDDSTETVMEEMKRCDLLLIMGTSLSTQPVSNYVKLFEDKDIIVMNQTSVHIPNRKGLTIQMVGSFKEMLANQMTLSKQTGQTEPVKQFELFEHIEHSDNKKYIIQYKDGIIQKRKYISDWIIL